MNKYTKLHKITHYTKYRQFSFLTSTVLYSSIEEKDYLMHTPSMYTHAHISQNPSPVLVNIN